MSAYLSSLNFSKHIQTAFLVISLIKQLPLGIALSRQVNFQDAYQVGVCRFLGCSQWLPSGVSGFVAKHDVREIAIIAQVCV